jgi:hypothetical protein
VRSVRLPSRSGSLLRGPSSIPGVRRAAEAISWRPSEWLTPNAIYERDTRMDVPKMKRTRSATPPKDLWARAQALVKQGCSEEESRPLLLQEDYTASQRYRILALARDQATWTDLGGPQGIVTIPAIIRLFGWRK